MQCREIAFQIRQTTTEVVDVSTLSVRLMIADDVGAVQHR